MKNMYINATPMKVVIIGDSQVGKSSLIQRYINNIFLNHIDSTIGVEFNSRVIVKDDIAIKLQIWDTAGQERFKSITRIYYRNANVIILMFDLTNRKSLESIIDWVNDIMVNIDCTSVNFYLVGTKMDLDNKEVTGDDIQGMMFILNGIGISITEYFEISSKMNDNVGNLFEHISECLIDVYKIMPHDTKPNILDNYSDGNCCY